MEQCSNEAILFLIIYLFLENNVFLKLKLIKIFLLLSLAIVFHKTISNNVISS